MTPDQATFLNGRRVAYLATTDEGGRPHVLPICFACRDGMVYSPVDEKPKRRAPGELQRVRDIAAHPDVCLLAEVYDEDWARLAWLQVRGTARLVVDAGERAPALAALRERYVQYGTMDLESRPLIRIEPGRVISWAASPLGSGR